MENRSNIDNPGETSHHNRVMHKSQPDFAAGKNYWGSDPKEVQAKADFAQAEQASDNPVSAHKDPKKDRAPFISQINIEIKNHKIQEIVNYAQKVIQTYHSLAPLEKICNRLPLFSHYQHLLREQFGTLSVLELDFMLKDINASIHPIQGIHSKYTLPDFICENNNLMIKALEDAKRVEKSRDLEPDAAPLIQRMEALCILTKEKFIRPLETFNLGALSDLSENLRKELVSRLKEPENFDKLYTPLFDITTYIGPPQDVLNRYEQKAEQHWRKVYHHFYPDKFNGLKGEEGYLAFVRALDDHAKNLIENVNFFRHVQASELEYILANPDEKLASMYKNSKDQRKITRRALKTKAFYNYPDHMGPMHGYLSTNEDGSKKGSEAGLKQSYGAIRLRLKKEQLIGKTTVAFDDSWHYYQPKNNEIAVMPRPLVQPDRKAFPIGENREILTLLEKLFRRKVEGDRQPIDQTKIKRLLKNEDIRCLVEQLFDSKVERRNEEDHKLIGQLEDLLDKERDHLLINPLTIKSIDDIQAYAEFQHHFTDLIIKDIDKVYLPASNHTEAQMSSIIDGLNAHKIKYEFYNVDEASGLYNNIRLQRSQSNRSLDLSHGSQEGKNIAKEMALDAWKTTREWLATSAIKNERGALITRKIHDLVPECNCIDDKDKNDLTRQIDNYIIDLCIDNLHNKGGYYGIITQDCYFQKEDARPGKELVPEVNRALDQIKVGNVCENVELFKIDPGKIKELKDYINKKTIEKLPEQDDFSPVKIHKSIVDLYKRISPHHPENHFSPEEAINLLKEADSTGLVRYQYDHPLSLIKKESINLSEHTVRVSQVGETFILPGWGRDDRPDLEGVNSIMKPDEFRWLLLMHDFGKPSAPSAEQQQLAIVPLTAELLKKIQPSKAELIHSILKIDIGELYKQVGGKWGKRSKTPEDVAKELQSQIAQIAEEHKIDPKALARICEAYFKCDSASYDSMADFYRPAYDDKSKTWRLDFDEKRQKGHNILFRAFK
jgi:hypothetical protein